MTSSELKRLILEKHPQSHFFDRKTMSFFGDTMANFGVQSLEHTWKMYRKSDSWKMGKGSAKWSCWYVSKTTHDFVAGDIKTKEEQTT